VWRPDIGVRREMVSQATARPAAASAAQASIAVWNPSVMAAGS
jgi:hypothetical protein